MGAGDPLRRLDQRVLPPLGRAPHRLGRGAGRMRLLTVAAAGHRAGVPVGVRSAGAHSIVGEWLTIEPDVVVRPDGQRPKEQDYGDGSSAHIGCGS